jgi:hypothetical protein
MFAVRRKALVPANETPARRSLVRWETEPALVLAAAPLVREVNARQYRVILRESDVGTSLDVIHSTFGCLNSASSRRRGCQKSVSPSEEKLRLAWVSNGNPFTRRQVLSTDSIRLRLSIHPVTPIILRLLLSRDCTLVIYKRIESNRVVIAM